jgi:hypothetical protein
MVLSTAAFNFNLRRYNVAKNPQNMSKYQNNPKVLAFYQQMAGMVGKRLENMGDNSTSGV